MTERRATTVVSALAGAVVLAGLAAPSAAVAQDVDARWLPWVGCWEKVAAPADEPMLCVRPSADGVDLLTVSRGEVRETAALVADGVERPSEAEGCTGTEQTRFSADAGRLYRSSDLECGAAIGRVSSRMWAMVSPTEWIDVRAIRVEGEGAAWVERYRPAPAARVEAAGLDGLTDGWMTGIEASRMAASTPIGVEDIIEASAAVGDEVVKSWLAERGSPIRLDADRLVQLADAGVSSEVIDVAIAISYPERFAVAQEPRDGRQPTGRRYPVYLDPFGCSSFSMYSSPYCYSRYGYGYGYGRYGYYGLGSYSGYGYGGPTVVVVRPNDTSTRPSGRMVKGRGYSGSGSSGSGQAVRPRTTQRTPNVSTRSTGSRGTATTTRTAKPRTAKPRGGGSGSSGSGGSGQ